MALQVWMPLIKQELTQQGLSSGTLNGTPNWGQGGKISEKCFRCDGPVTTTVDGLKNVTTFSIAYWLYVDSSISTFSNYADFFQLQATSGNTTTVIRDELRANTANLGRHAFHMIKDASVGSNTYTYYGLGDRDDAKDKWCHVVVTKDANYCDAYADGVRYAHVACSNFESSPCKLTGAMQLGMPGCTSGYLQDFRVYDHVLSQMEVKELSKGLVLHYPLNRGGWGQENLLLNTGTPATWSQGLNSNNYATHDCFKTQSPVPSLFSVDELITISFDWSTTATGGNFRLECGAATPWIWGTVISSKGTRNSASNFIDISSSNQSGHAEITFKITSAQTEAADTLQWFRIRHDGADTANKTFTISKAKLEKGSIATPWCPNSSDNLADEMGLNGTTEYDCSGYCNNGTRTGTFKWTSDTPKYQVSTSLSNNASKLHISGLSTSGFGNSYSIAWWGKTNSFSGLMQWGFSDGIRLNGIFNGNLWNTGDSANNPLYIPGTTTQVTVPTTNVWHHFVMTGDGTTCKVYKDGELWGQAKTYKAISGTSIYFNGWDSSTSYSNNNGYSMSDFRIYATALSADDVKSLYQNCATIDPDGTIRGQIRS